jgi:antirestriction protein ArdC
VPRPRLKIPPLPPPEEMIKDLSKTSKVTVIPGYGMIIDKKEENEGRLVTTAGTPHELTPFIQEAQHFTSWQEMKAAIDMHHTPDMGFGSVMLNGREIPIESQDALREWAKQQGFQTEEKGFQALKALASRQYQRGDGTPPVTTTPAYRVPASPGVYGKEVNQAEGVSPGHSPRDVQAEITDKIIEAIETGQANGTFQMPWQAIASEGLPVNVVTHQPYHGVNILFLSLVPAQHKWPNQWASFQQWRERGASVKRGEHGVPVFYSPVQIQDVEEDEEGKREVVMKTIPVFHHSTVFNIAQVDNPPSVTTTPPIHPIEKVEQFINATKADIRYGGNRAYFSPSFDYIQMPKREAFTGTKTSSSTEAFYSTILHELCHWTGGTSRLNRDIANRFGEEGYAAEELVAEIGAAFACAELGITPELRDDHVQYVASWLKILKEDKRAIFTASAAAAHAVEYLQTLQPKA